MENPNDKMIKKVYNAIAEGFYNIRQQPITPEIEQVAKKWMPGKILDIGCSIGNSLLPFAKTGFQCYGIDISHRMISLAKQYANKHDVRYFLKTSTMLKLPFKKHEFDYVISIAAFHHLDNEKKRLRALSEIKRVLSPEGKFFITVWYKRTPDKDVYIPWNRKGVSYNRYYHFFTKEELSNIFRKSGIKSKIYMDKHRKNICITGNNLLS